MLRASYYLLETALRKEGTEGGPRFLWDGTFGSSRVGSSANLRLLSSLSFPEATVELELRSSGSAEPGKPGLEESGSYTKSCLYYVH